MLFCTHIRVQTTALKVEFLFTLHDQHAHGEVLGVLSMCERLPRILRRADVILQYGAGQRQL